MGPHSHHPDVLAFICILPQEEGGEDGEEAALHPSLGWAVPCGSLHGAQGTEGPGGHCVSPPPPPALWTCPPWVAVLGPQKDGLSVGPPSLEEATASPPTSAIPPGSLPSTFPESCPLRVPPHPPEHPHSELRGSEICRPCLFCEIHPDPSTGRFSVCSLPCVSARGIFCSPIRAEKT